MTFGSYLKSTLFSLLLLSLFRLCAVCIETTKRKKKLFPFCINNEQELRASQLLSNLNMQFNICNSQFVWIWWARTWKLVFVLLKEQNKSIAAANAKLHQKIYPNYNDVEGERDRNGYGAFCTIFNSAPMFSLMEIRCTVCTRAHNIWNQFECTDCEFTLSHQTCALAFQMVFQKVQKVRCATIKMQMNFSYKLDKTYGRWMCAVCTIHAEYFPCSNGILHEKRFQTQTHTKSYKKILFIFSFRQSKLYKTVLIYRSLVHFKLWFISLY